MIRKKLFCIAFCCIGLIIACSDDNSMRNVDLDESAFLVNVGTNIIVPAYTEFELRARALDESIVLFGTSATTENLQNVKVKLKAARLSWQLCNMFGFGPASDVALTSDVNIFPVDKTQIDNNIESGAYELGTLSNNDAKGLPGIAYLIFGEDESEEEILVLFTTDEHAAKRHQYLADLSSKMLESAQTVLNTWNSSYLAQFTSAASFGTSVGSSTSQLFNTMVQTYERQTRDGKIGIPVGVRTLGEAIPTSTEAYHGGYSAELAIANIAQYKILFNGDEGTGFDDYLKAHDRADLVTSINAKFDAILSALEGLNDPLADEIVNQKASVEAVFVLMQDLVNLLKTEVASQLSIDITYIDMDGD